ncbi:MAG TPA: T9SS type A sorting domain-containing protein, partial [Candidatus Kapabacteria bacterium]|nr:T9SS type A sorting domain-containing protein [Candidatus Kapabacteria bacterium]
LGISSVSAQPISITQDILSYPNPFSQSTQLAFTTASAGYADVSIVNALGAEVAHFFSGELGAGNHSFAWDALGVAPGSYWCIVRTRDGVRRIGLLRE